MGGSLADPLAEADGACGGFAASVHFLPTGGLRGWAERLLQLFRAVDLRRCEPPAHLGELGAEGRAALLGVALVSFRLLLGQTAIGWCHRVQRIGSERVDRFCLVRWSEAQQG
ncbi:MAG: hypothetical protein HOV78_05345 [Hamadaea sp.]|nr:hypothetical protein [Hamadaea sp.]